MYGFLVLYCLLIVTVSLIGGTLPHRITMDHRRTQMVLSFVAGVMLGVALLHLMPHAVNELDEIEWAFGSALAGLLFMFFMIRWFNFHQHDAPCEETRCDDEHHHHHSHQDISWIALTFGLVIHSIIDGVALAVAYQAEQASELTLPAVGIFLAVLLHKPLDSLSIISLMKAKKVATSGILATNILFALACPLGVLMAVLGLRFAGDMQPLILGITLGFTAGVFICISLSDLLPEVQFHSHDRFALSGMLILGISIAIGIALLPGR